MNLKNSSPVVYYYNIFDLMTATLLLIACLCYRPMLLGNNYSNIGLSIFIFLIVISIIKRQGKIIIKRSSHFKTYICCLLLFVYCFFQCILTNSDRMIAGIQTTILLTVSATAFYLILLNKSVQVIFVKLLYYLMMLFVVSYIISTILMLSSGWESIMLTSYDYGYYRNTDIYFPLTTTYGSMPFMGIIFRRLLGFARESGLMQIFYVWGFFSADKYFKKSKIVQALLAIGLLVCFSSAGFIVFAISLLLYFDIRDLLKKQGIIKSISICLIFVIVCYIVLFAQGTSISSRAEATINDRMSGIYYGLSVFMDHPIIGGGFYSTLGNQNIQTGVCAIASLGQVGFLGFILWTLIFFYDFVGCTDKKRYIYTNAALFITALFSQPIMFAPVMYVFNFLDCDTANINLKKKKR